MTEFEDHQALDLFDAVEGAIIAYEAYTGRSFINDQQLRAQLTSHEDGQTLLDGLDVDNAMVAFYDSGTEVNAWGDDRYASEASYFTHVDDVAKAMDAVGIRQEEPEDEPEEPEVVYYDGPSAAETYRQHWDLHVELHS